DELGNVLFVASFSIQLPDPFVDSNPLAMTSTTLLFPFRRCCCLGRRACFSCQASRSCFEHARFVMKDLLQSFGEVLLQMKAIDNLLGLGSAIRRCFAEEFSTIARDHLNLGMRAQPRFAGLYRTIRK